MSAAYKALEIAARERDGLKDAIHQFLDQIDRPVGRLEFSIKSDPQTNQAILRLFDAVERNP